MENKITKIITYTTVFSLVISGLSIKGYGDAVNINLFKIMNLSDFFNYSIEILLSNDTLSLIIITYVFHCVRFIKNKWVSGLCIAITFLTVFKPEFLIITFVVLLIYMIKAKIRTIEVIMNFIEDIEDHILLVFIVLTFLSYMYGYREAYNLKKDTKDYNVKIIIEQEKITDSKLVFSFNEFLVVKEKGTKYLKVIKKDKIKEIIFNFKD